ncbi:VanZ family protein [Kitasatospora sp. NPDC089797]|uniref:VanZ family protein n=1 Tax=Kitasatospora sp. NPDC089797 TaxID=3155298 RepID=UPI00342FACCA
MFRSIISYAISVDFIPLVIPLALPVAALSFWLARRKVLPVAATILWGLALLAELVVTMPSLTPGAAQRVCNVGAPGFFPSIFATAPGLLNIVMYVPLGLFGALAFRRPLVNFAACVNLAVATEIFQGIMANGRGCDASTMVANSLGALVGSGAAVGWLRFSRARTGLDRRDLVRGSLVLTAGMAVLSVVLVSTLHVLTGSDFVNKRKPSDLAPVLGARLFGQGVQIKDVSLAKDGLSVTSTTDRGTFTFSWPTSQLLSFESADMHAEPGNLADDDLAKRGSSFAQQWWPYAIKDATPTLQPGSGEIPARVFNYRRIRGGILMPLRIDITIDASGRVLSAAASDFIGPDPDGLAPVAVSMDEAKRGAEIANPGEKAANAFLLVKKVNDQWRTLWAVNLSGAKAFGVFLDATSGEIVTPDKRP